MHATIVKSKLPAGWVYAKLSDLVIDIRKDFVDGPFGSNLKANEYIEEGVPVFKIQNIKAGYFVDKNIQYVSEEKANELVRHSFQIGDIIITKLGEPLGLCCKVPQKYPYGIIVADLMRIRPYEVVIDIDYLTYVINSKFVQDQFKDVTKGTTRARVNLTIVRDIEVFLPPYNEQKRIASKLDEILSDIENTSAQFKQSLTQLKNYKQSLFSKAFNGKLTEKWRNQNNSESSKTLLESFNERAKSRYKYELSVYKEDLKKYTNKIKKNKPVKPTKPVESKIISDKEIEALPKLPDNWTWVRNNDLIYYVTSGSRDWKKYYSTEGALFIRTQDIKTNFLNFNSLAKVSLPRNVEGKRSLVEKGDLLMTITGANVGKIAHIVEKIPEAYVSQSVALIKPIDYAISPFLHLYFQSLEFGGKMISNSVYGVGRPVLSLENIRDALVVLPPLNEQLAIITELDFHLSTISNLENTIKRALLNIEELRQSTFKSAFEGRLVAQDSDDVSAHTLLKKVEMKRKEYYQNLQNEENLKLNPSKMKEEISNGGKDIISILRDANKPLSAKHLWEQSKFKDDIEQFYAELKKVRKNIIEVEKGILLYKNEDR